MSYYECDPRKHPPTCDEKVCYKKCFITTNRDWSLNGMELSEELVAEREKARNFLTKWRRNEDGKGFFKHFRNYAERDQASDQRGAESGH